MAVPLTLDPSERGFVLGATGEGKTVWTKAAVLKPYQKAHWRIVIFDPKHFWLGRYPEWERKGPGTVDRPRLVQAFNPKLAVQCYQPIAPGWKDEALDAFCDAILAEGRTVVYLDECDGVVDSARWSPGLSRLWTQGRALDIAAWAGAQRPFRLPEWMKSQAETWAVFPMRGDRNRACAAEYTDTPQIVSRRLPKHWYWLWHVGMEHAQIMRPLPPKLVKATPHAEH